MAIAKLNQNSELLARFNAFVTAAKGAGKDDVFVQDEAEGQQFALRRSAEDKIGKCGRGDALKQANDNVRDVFKQTVLGMLGKHDETELDDELRTALRLDDYGKGKPLSARRILAVNAVIQKEIALNVNAEFVNTEMADTQGKIRSSIDNRQLESLFVQTCFDVFRAGGRRPTEDELQLFRNDPYAKVEMGGPGHFFLLNGDAFPAPANVNDTSAIKKFASSFLFGGLPPGREIPQQASRNLNVGEFVPMESLADGANVTSQMLANKLLDDADDNDRAAFISKLNDLPDALGGGIVVTDQGAKLVTRRERELFQAMVYCCQQSTLSFGQAFLTQHEDALGGSVNTIQKKMQNTLNVIRADDGYDVVMRSKIPFASVGDFDVGVGVTAYDPEHLPVVEVEAVIHIGWSDTDGGHPTVTAKTGDHAPKVTLLTAEPISKAEFKSRMRQIVERGGVTAMFGDNPLARKWYMSLPKSERKALQDNLVNKFVENTYDEGVALEFIDSNDTLLPWKGGMLWEVANDKLSALEKLAADHANSGDFYVRRSSAGGVPFESAGARNVLRTSASKKENNEIRKELKDCVYAYYKGDVPESVLAEMTNFDGEGHPLSAKRIGRICAAIKQERADRLSEMEFQPGKTIGDISSVSPALADVVERVANRIEFSPDNKRRLARLMAIATNPNLGLQLDPNNREEFMSSIGLADLNNMTAGMLIKKVAEKLRELSGGKQQFTLVTTRGEPYEVTISDKGDIQAMGA